MAAVVFTLAATLLAGVDGEPWRYTATQPATRAATTVVNDEWTTYTYPPPPPVPDWAACPQWWELARDVGWPESQLPTLDHVMWRESRCNPHAYNPTPCAHRDHAIGLTQLCGWGGAELYDPHTNLERALWLWHRFGGWCPWHIKGDPATGPAC